MEKEVTIIAITILTKLTHPYHVAPTTWTRKGVARVVI